MTEDIKGPWNFDGHGINDRGHKFAPRVATLSGEYRNAEVGNLLAAAPEMLKAAEQVLREWDASGGACVSSLAMDGIRTAIKHGKGEDR